MNINQSIDGQFVVNDNDNIQIYDFQSISNETLESIQFTLHPADRSNIYSWTGFILYHTNDSKLILYLFKNSHSDVYEAVDTIIISRTNQLNETDEFILKSWLQSVICQYYVELSVKLASLGLLGNHSKAIYDLHSFAQWVWNTANQDIDVNNAY